jgi:hypothetical protein
VEFIGKQAEAVDMSETMTFQHVTSLIGRDHQDRHSNGLLANSKEAETEASVEPSLFIFE